MCGICGTVGITDIYQKRLLAYANRKRGVGGCGFAWIENGKWETSRQPLDLADEMADNEDYWRSDVLLVHTRRPSPGLLGGGGAVKVENTHPFTHGKTILAHNGKMRNADEETESVLDKTFPVDSDAFTALAEEVGFEKACSRFDGMAGIWTMQSDDASKFYLWVWDQDLALWSNGEGQIAFSSELNHLRSAGFTESNGEIGELSRKKGIMLEVNTSNGSMKRKDIRGYTPPPVATKQTGAYKATSGKIFLISDHVMIWRRGKHVYGRVKSITSGKGASDLLQIKLDEGGIEHRYSSACWLKQDVAKITKPDKIDVKPAGKLTELKRLPKIIHTVYKEGDRVRYKWDGSQCTGTVHALREYSDAIVIRVEEEGALSDRIVNVGRVELEEDVTKAYQLASLGVILQGGEGLCSCDECGTFAPRGSKCKWCGEMVVDEWLTSSVTSCPHCFWVGDGNDNVCPVCSNDTATYTDERSIIAAYIASTCNGDVQEKWTKDYLAMIRGIKDRDKKREFVKIKKEMYENTISES